MYMLSILSIMRDSLPYFERYIDQVNSAFKHFDHCHLLILEGDSTDGTKERLAQIAAPDNTEVQGDVTVIEMDQGNQKMGNISHPGRWYALTQAWNTNLKYLEPTKYAVCVESDLIWAWDVLGKMIKHLDAGVGDVMLPMLMRDTPTTGRYYYDTHANIARGEHFANYMPYHPALKADEPFLVMDRGGGMLVAYGTTLQKAVWDKECVLEWAAETRVVMDTHAEIFHP